MNASAAPDPPSPVARRILVIDDHELLAESLVFRLRRAGVEARAVVTREPGTIVETARAFGPDVVLLDVMLGDRTSIPAIGPLTEATGAPVIMVTGLTDRLTLAECIEAGAAGVVSKTHGFTELLDRIFDVLQGGNADRVRERASLLGELRRRRSEEQQRLAPFHALTSREQQVLAALMDGQHPKDIAAACYVSVGTVRCQIKAIHRKLGVSSQLAAVALARDAGWSPRRTGGISSD